MAAASNIAAVQRQVRASEIEAAFSLACTLAVCVRQEWGQWDQVGAAIAIPVAMAFSVHGANNATGLQAWNWAYIPTRVAVICLGVAYSYQHYYHFFGDLAIGGFDLRPFVAVIMELLTLSALIAHQAHSSRLASLTSDVDTAADDDAQPILPIHEIPAVPDRKPQDHKPVRPLVLRPTKALVSLNGTGQTTPTTTT